MFFIKLLLLFESLFNNHIGIVLQSGGAAKSGVIGARDLILFQAILGVYGKRAFEKMLMEIETLPDGEAEYGLSFIEQIIS